MFLGNIFPALSALPAHPIFGSLTRANGLLHTLTPIGKGTSSPTFHTQYQYSSDAPLHYLRAVNTTRKKNSTHNASISTIQRTTQRLCDQSAGPRRARSSPQITPISLQVGVQTREGHAWLSLDLYTWKISFFDVLSILLSFFVTH